MSKIIIGMSGGVDSAVSAYLLLKKGYKVKAVFMKNWEEDDEEFCSVHRDLKDAEIVCEHLGIELKKINLSNEYWEYVFKVFLSEYKNGNTPNPDILCNSEIKFKIFLQYALSLGADKIAMGHYVRIIKNKNNYIELIKGFDKKKDQSYFLYALSQKQLNSSIFPVGNMTKKEVRNIAIKLGFINAKKKDSTGICFIGHNKFKKFLERFFTKNFGDIITTSGEKIGEHEGLMFYTIGQRKGLKIGGNKNFSEDAWYVSKKDIKKNQLIVVQGEKNHLLYKKKLKANNINWISGHPPSSKFFCNAKIRYQQNDKRCIVLVKKKNIEVIFHEPQRAITSGQSVVLYLKEKCLGGGIIM